jgi:hypothetical protein
LGEIGQICPPHSSEARAFARTRRRHRPVRRPCRRDHRLCPSRWDRARRPGLPRQRPFAFSNRTGVKVANCVTHNKHTRGPAICNERVFRWRKLLETGVYGTIEELAAAEKINSSYVSRILRLTLLAPSIVEAILDGQHAPELTLANIMKPFPSCWDEQTAAFHWATPPDQRCRSARDD